MRDKNIIAHSSPLKFLARSVSSQKAETFLELVTKRIKDFGLAIDDIVAFLNNGASIIMKLRRLAPCEF